MRNRKIIWAGVALFAVVIGCNESRAAELGDFTIEGFVGWDHTSDVLRGKPFFRHDTRPDPQLDMIGGGFTVSRSFRFGRLEVDFMQGYKALDCWVPGSSCDWETGTRISTRFYPGRNK